MILTMPYPSTGCAHQDRLSRRYWGRPQISLDETSSYVQMVLGATVGGRLLLVVLAVLAVLMVLIVLMVLTVLTSTTCSSSSSSSITGLHSGLVMGGACKMTMI